MQAELVAFLPRALMLPEGARKRFERTSANIGLSTHRLAGGPVLALRGPAVLGQASAIVGDVFADAGEPMPQLASLCQRLEHDAAPLHGHGCWGDYLTLGAAPVPGNSWLGRSPFGNLPCFWIAEDAHVVAASSANLLEAYATAPLSVDWRRLAILLLSPQMRDGSTCLDGVHELLPGSTLVVTGSEVAVRSDWSPWTFAQSASPLETVEDAAEIVARSIDLAVAGRCGSLHDPVLLLSGGLDSSVVAASLARAGRSFSALTMVTRHRSGDERPYARAVARATGVHLRECLRKTSEIDWEDETPRRLVRPSARVFRQPTLRAAHRLARETGADTILDGGGGDDLFCSLNSVVPLLDRLAIEGPCRGGWRTARDIALRADVDVFTVMRKAMRRRLSGRVAFGWPTVGDFMTTDTHGLSDEAAHHPWLEPPPGALPGQAAHVALVLDALGLAEDDSIDPAMRTISPLVAQPVAEAALRVRSWLWVSNGRTRAVVRQGFAGRLPRAVLDRTGKGTPGGFIAELVEEHRPRLREMVLDGLLVAHGIADRTAIEAALSDTAIARDERLVHLLVLADAERWARLWTQDI